MNPDQVHLTFAWPQGLVVAAVLALAALWLERRVRSRWRNAVLRAIVIALLVGAATRPAIELGASSATVVLADRSASVDPAAVDARLAELGLPRDNVAVLAFGDETTSDLAQAIEAGARALPDGGRLVLVTDGRATGADPERAAARAAELGVSVEVVPLSARTATDAAVVAIDAPVAHRAGDPVPVTIAVQGSAPLTGTLTLLVNGRVVEDVPLSTSLPGVPTVYRTVLDAAVGALELSARFEVPGDKTAANDVAVAFVQEAAPLEVLIVGEAEGAVRLADLLETVGVRPTVAGAGRVPGRLSELMAYDVIVLVDMPVRDLGVDQLAGIEAFVGDLGRGLVVTGGRQAYLAGGWQSTPLEWLVPVRLEPSTHGTRDPVALVFMIDQSASMGTADSRTGVSKLDLAREAAALSADVLHPGDTVGVVAYDDSARWLVPLTTTGTGREMADMQAALAGLVTGGGTRIREALELGLPALSNLGDADVDVLRRHAVLISDGRDFHDDGARNESAVKRARASNVTLSTIAIGFDADRPMLERLARIGRGRYHSADDPSDLPRLAVEESEIARANAERRGAFQPIPAGAGDHPALHGVDATLLPDLNGYVSVTPRTGADMVLESPAGDVLMATWQYGLGRVTAWTSDVGEEWATDWTDATEAAAFWRRTLGYVSRGPAVGPPGVTVDVDGGLAHVVVDAIDEKGRTDDLASASVRYHGSAPSTAHDLPQTAPGRYEGTLALEDRASALMIRMETDVGVTEISASPRYLVPDELVPGRRDRLPGIVLASSGRVLNADEIATFRAATRYRHVPLWQVLLAVAAVVWLIDVARQTGTPEVRWRPNRMSRNRARTSEHDEEDSI